MHLNPLVAFLSFPKLLNNMAHIFATLLFVLILASLGLGRQAMAGEETPFDQGTAAKAGYYKLPTGTIVFEGDGAVPAAAREDLSAIAPAAGPDATAADTIGLPAPTFKYNPLTQTYRRTMVTPSGTEREDVISDPNNPNQMNAHGNKN